MGINERLAYMQGFTDAVAAIQDLCLAERYGAVDATNVCMDHATLGLLPWTETGGPTPILARKGLRMVEPEQEEGLPFTDPLPVDEIGAF